MAYTGTGAQVAIGKESVWGTAVPDTLLVPFLSESIKLTAKKVEEDNLLATKAAAAYDLMALTVAGDVTGVLKPEIAGFLIKAALGSTDTVTNPTGTYCHTMVAQTAAGAIPSYTVFVNRKAAIKKYSGCKIDTLKLSAKVGDYVKFTATFKGKDEATATIATSTNPSLKSYKFIGATITVGGTAFDVTGFDLTINNQLADGVQLNTSGLYVSEPVHTSRKIQVSVDMPYDANSEAMREANFKAETVVSSIVLHLESPAIIATTYKYRMDITLNNVAILDAASNVGGKDVITMSWNGEATAVGATEPISIAVYDGTATAY